MLDIVRMFDTFLKRSYRKKSTEWIFMIILLQRPPKLSTLILISLSSKTLATPFIVYHNFITRRWLSFKFDVSMDKCCGVGYLSRTKSGLSIM